MAWISVDQKLIGGKLRTLHKAIGCSRNEAIGILVTLWLWGIDNSEADGMIPSACRGDIAGVLRQGINDDLDPGYVVDCLIENGWIDDIGGQLYLHDWKDWRTYYNKYVKNKQSNSERQARYKARHTETDSGEVGTADNGENNVTDNVIKPSTDTSGKKAGKKNPVKYSKDFEEFWEVYPRKNDKGPCNKKYIARIRDGYSPEELLEASRNYAEECRVRNTEQRYIKHGKTFLSDSLPFTEYISKKNDVAQEETKECAVRSL